MQWKTLRFQRLILAKWQVWGRLGSNVICNKDNSATAIHHTGKCACVVCTEYTIKEVGVLKKYLEPRLGLLVLNRISFYVLIYKCHAGTCMRNFSFCIPSFRSFHLPLPFSTIRMQGRIHAGFQKRGSC